jgi:hypothetical protein
MCTQYLHCIHPPIPFLIWTFLKEYIYNIINYNIAKCYHLIPFILHISRSLFYLYSTCLAKNLNLKYDLRITALTSFYKCQKCWILGPPQINWISTCLFNRICIILFYFVGLGFELRALHLQSRRSTTWTTPLESAFLNFRRLF